MREMLGFGTNVTSGLESLHLKNQVDRPVS